MTSIPIETSFLSSSRTNGSLCEFIVAQLRDPNGSFSYEVSFLQNITNIPYYFCDIKRWVHDCCSVTCAVSVNGVVLNGTRVIQAQCAPKEIPQAVLRTRAESLRLLADVVAGRRDKDTEPVDVTQYRESTEILEALKD